MAIEETITVDVAGLGEVDDLAGALDKAAESAAKLKGDLASLGATSLDLSAAGPGKLVAAWDEGFAKIKAGFDDLAGSAAKIGDLGAAGPEKLVASWSEGLAGLRDEIGETADAAGKLGDIGAAAGESVAPVGELGDALKGVSESGAGLAPAADSIKGIGDSADEAAAQVAALRAEMAETAAANDKLMADIAATSGGSDASIALGQRLNTTAARDASGDAVAAQAAASKQAAADAEAAEASASKYHMAALGAAGALAYGIDLAAKLQAGGVRLETSAGESASNLPADERGILSLSGQVNQSQANLIAGMYTANSGGFHGANALAVERSAGEGATAENANLGTVTNALTTLLTDYFGGPQKSAKTQQDQATSAMNAIMASVGSGKMTLQDLATAMPVLLPTAKSAGLSLQQVLGAESTMTAQGSSTEASAQEIRHTITSIEKPTNVQAAEMQMLGISPVQLSHDLGSQGLTGTIAEVDKAIKTHMTSGGMVLLDTMNQSKLATQSANEEIAAMPANLQSAAKAYLDGSVSAKQWNAEMFSGSESAKDKNLLQQFATTANLAMGYSTLVKAGGGNKQTPTAALNELLGGQVGSQVALQVGGANLKTFEQNVRTVGDATKQSGDNIKNWGDVQKTLSYQLGSSTKSLEAIATEAGQVALPTVTTALKGIADAGGFFAAHPAVTKPLVETGGVLAAMALVPKLANAGSTLLASVGKVGQVLQIPGADKLANLGKSSTTGAAAASGSLDRVAGAGDAAAAALDRVAGAGGAAAAGEDAAGAAGDRAAAGEDAAGAAGGKGGGALGTIGTIAIGAVISKAIIDGLENKKNPQVLGNTNPKSPWNSWDSNDSLGGKAVRFLEQGPDVARTQASSPAFWRAGPGGAAPAAPAKIPAPDVSSLNVARADTVRDISQINAAIKINKPPAVPAPDLSLLAGAKGKAASAGEAIQQAVTTALHKPAKAAAPDLSAYSAARGPATADGAALSAGFAQGIESGKGAAVAASEDVAGAATAAMATKLDTHSPSKVTEAIGKDTSTGLAKGVTEGTSAVKTSALTLSAATITSLTQGLQGGSSAIDAAMQAVTGKGSRPQDITTIMSTISTLKGDVAQALSAGQISRPEDSALTKMLKADNTKLQALSAQRTVIETEITDAQQIAQQAISNANITSAGSYTPADAASSGPLASSATISGLQAQLADSKAFAEQVGQLKKMGLNSTSLNQIVQSGASTGLPVAQGITSGGKAAVKEINQLESQIQSSAAKLGGEAAGPMYQAGVQAGQGLAQGLQSQLGAIDGAIQQIASQMVATLKKDLKIKSPSGVFAELGGQVPAGAAMGVDAGAGSAAAAVSRMGSRMAGAFHPSLAYAGHGGGYGGGSRGSGSGGGDTHITVNLTVQGSVSTQNDLVNAVKKGLLKTGSQNWQTGIIKPGRAG